MSDRKSTRLNSSHTEIYTLSLHDALPIFELGLSALRRQPIGAPVGTSEVLAELLEVCRVIDYVRSEEHTSELQSHRDLHSFPTRRSSDLRAWPVRAASSTDRGAGRYIGGPGRAARGLPGDRLC